MKASAAITHSGGESFTTCVEGPEHGVTQTLQHFRQHLRTKQKMETREKTKALDKRVRSTNLIWRQKDFQCWYLRQCSSLAAFHWHERRQQCKQVPAREVMTANKRRREIYIQPINIHHRQNTVGTNFILTILTCGKLWVSSVWLEFLQFSPCQKTNCHPATEKQEIISHLVR